MRNTTDQILPNQGEKTLKTVDSRMPLTGSEVSRPALPAASEVVFDNISLRQGLTVFQTDRRRKPPHVRRNIRIAWVKPEQEIRRFLVEPARKRPLWHHDTRHVRFHGNLVINLTILEVGDVRSRKLCHKEITTQLQARSRPD